MPAERERRFLPLPVSLAAWLVLVPLTGALVVYFGANSRWLKSRLGQAVDADYPHARLVIGGVAVAATPFDVHLFDAVLSDEGGRPLVTLPHVRLETPLTGPFGSITRVSALTVTGATLDVRVRPDGSLDLATALAKPAKADADEAAPPKPLEVGALVLQDARLGVHGDGWRLSIPQITCRGAFAANGPRRMKCTSGPGRLLLDESLLGGPAELPVQLDDLSVLATPDSLEVTGVTLTLGAERVSLTGRLTLPAADGALPEGTVHLQGALPTPLVRALSGGALTSLGNLTLDVTSTPTALSVTLSNLRFSTATAAVTVADATIAALTLRVADGALTATLDRLSAAAFATPAVRATDLGLSAAVTLSFPAAGGALPAPGATLQAFRRIGPTNLPDIAVTLADLRAVSLAGARVSAAGLSLDRLSLALTGLGGLVFMRLDGLAGELRSGLLRAAQVSLGPDTLEAVELSALLTLAGPALTLATLRATTGAGALLDAKGQGTLQIVAFKPRLPFTSELLVARLPVLSLIRGAAGEVPADLTALVAGQVDGNLTLAGDVAAPAEIRATAAHLTVTEGDRRTELAPGATAIPGSGLRHDAATRHIALGGVVLSYPPPTAEP